jgi:hypothetical protein
MFALLAGYLLYSGLSSRLEKQHYRLRLKESLQKQSKKFENKAKSSKAEQLLNEAGNPLGLNGVKWEILKWTLLSFLLINYIVYPTLLSKEVSMYSILFIIVVMVMLSPTFPFSITRFILNRLVDYKKAKRSSELFSLYDMLISEIQMMQNTRVNAYSLLRMLKPYFKELDATMSRLLTNWTSDQGPEHALDVFAKEIGTNEAKSLANILKKFDENKRDAILKSLIGMEDMFINSQIENYRRRRKLYVDLANIPIKGAHFLIILNFVLVIVCMVSILMREAKL